MSTSHLMKWMLIGLGVVLALIVVTVIAFTLLVDPNDYRDEIAAQMQKHTGRELKIDGEISLSYFPWLGLELGAMQLGNARGFGPEPFASLEAADAKVKILPLFLGRVEMDTVVLHGLNLSLKRRRDGVTNWDDLTGEPTKAEAAVEPPPDAPPGRALAGLAIGGIELRGARVQWQDEVADQRVTISDFNLISGAISFDESFPLAIDGNVESGKPALRASLDLASNIALNLPEQRYRLNGTKLSLEAEGDAIPGGRAELALRGDLAADLQQQTASTSGLTVQIMGVTLTATVQGEQIIDKPAFRGELALTEFVPRQLLADLGVTLPEMADPSAMTKAALSTRFDAGIDHVSLQGLKMKLDNSVLSGEASVRRFSAPEIRYQLAMDEIDVDRYLSPPSEQPEPAQEPAGTAQAETPVALPLDLLRSLDINGTLKVGKVKVMNLHSDSILATVRGQKGEFRVNPLSARLYQGGYSGDLRLDVRGNTPALGMNEKLNGVEAGPLLIRKAYALYKKQPVPAEEVQQTDFSSLSGSFAVENGLVATSDLSVRSPLFQVEGKGTADLVSEKLDMRLDTTVVASLKDAANQSIDELEGVMVPITIKGSFSEPRFGVDVASVLRAKADAVVEKKKEEVREKAKERVEEEKEKLQKQLEDKFKNMLKF